MVSGTSCGVRRIRLLFRLCGASGANALSETTARLTSPLRPCRFSLCLFVFAFRPRAWLLTLQVNQSALLDAEAKADAVTVAFVCSVHVTFSVRAFSPGDQAATKANAGGKGRQQTSGGPPGKGGITCDYCGVPGHKKEQCFARKRALGGGDANQAKKHKGLAHFCIFAPRCCAAPFGSHAGTASTVRKLRG